MNIQMQQSNFSHCKCQACGHFAIADKFNPRMVLLSESNLPGFKFEVTSGDENILQTINYNCPICDSPYVEPFYPNEIN
jgi:hypothetical protein